MAEKESKSLNWLGVLTIIISPLVIIATLFFPSAIERTISNEVISIERLVGEQEANSLYKTATELSNTMLVDSGAINLIRKVLLPKDYLTGRTMNDDLALNTRFWQRIDNAIYGLVLNVDLTLLRLVALKMWSIAIIVVTVTSVISGLLMREIKKQGFEYSSPMRHGLGRRFMYSLPLLFFLYFLVPFSMPVYAVPFATVIYSASIIMIVANTIKRV
ncbi:DUF4400 domain-containing protein [Vibrio cholerae]